MTLHNIKLNSIYPQSFIQIGPRVSEILKVSPKMNAILVIELKNSARSELKLLAPPLIPISLIWLGSRLQEKKVDLERWIFPLFLIWQKVKLTSQFGLSSNRRKIFTKIFLEISRSYGVLLEDQGITLRGLFIIDPQGVIRQITINDLPVGR